MFLQMRAYRCGNMASMLRSISICCLAVFMASSLAAQAPAPAPPPPGTALALPEKVLGPLRISSGTAASNMLTAVNPVYPAEARKDRITGRVILHVIIDEQGNVTDLKVISSPDQGLTDASVHAVQQWKYKPYLLNGVATKVDTTITINFTSGH